MAAKTPTTEPATLIAGDTAIWLRSLPDYSAANGWTLTYTLINATAKITFAAISQGDNHLITVDAATTAAWTAGSYEWRAQVSKSGEVHTIASGNITISAGYSGASFDARSHARKALEAVEAYLENPNNLSAASYEIAGRKLQRLGIPDLLSLRDRYRFEVSQEAALARLARGLPDPRRVLVRFGP